MRRRRFYASLRIFVAASFVWRGFLFSRVVGEQAKALSPASVVPNSNCRDDWTLGFCTLKLGATLPPHS